MCPTIWDYSLFMIFIYNILGFGYLLFLEFSFVIRWPQPTRQQLDPCHRSSIVDKPLKRLVLSEMYFYMYEYDISYVFGLFL